MALIQESEMRLITKKLVKADPAFASVVKRSDLCIIGRKRPARSHFETLIESIISQMISTKAADTISQRVKDLAGGRLEAESLHKLKAEKFNGTGLTRAKTQAIKELAEAAVFGELNLKTLGRKSSADIEKELIQYRGIGRWTVEMFLMFHLGRLDVWPVGDLGVRRGWERMHKMKKEITPKELDSFSELFDGYQSVAAWYCWKEMDGPADFK